MRREMQEILPGLFLGPYSSAMKSKLPTLQKHGITHVICIRQNIEANFIKPNFQQLFRYLVLDIADNPIENIIRFFPMVSVHHHVLNYFIRVHFRTEGGNAKGVNKYL
ncbi:serine/threonine/tyrosine-interacting protein isoform X2 [Notechis scutatus]|nr:serine/threonine/tyrosine-interacting protein isoform X2 [Notechis scutatus]